MPMAERGILLLSSACIDHIQKFEYSAKGGFGREREKERGREKREREEESPWEKERERERG